MGSDSVVEKEIALKKNPIAIHSHPINSVPSFTYFHQAVYCDLYFPSNEEEGRSGGNEGREQRKNSIREVYIEVISGLLILSMLQVPLNIKILKSLVWSD